MASSQKNIDKKNPIPMKDGKEDYGFDLSEAEVKELYLTLANKLPERGFVEWKERRNAEKQKNASDAEKKGKLVKAPRRKSSTKISDMLDAIKKNQEEEAPTKGDKPRRKSSSRVNEALETLKNPTVQTSAEKLVSTGGLETLAIRSKERKTIFNHADEKVKLGKKK